MRGPSTIGGGRYRRAVARRVWVVAVHGSALAYGLLVVGETAGGLAAAAGLMLGITATLVTAGLAVAAVVDGALREEPYACDRVGPRCGCCGGSLTALGRLTVCETCDRLPRRSVEPRRP